MVLTNEAKFQCLFFILFFILSLSLKFDNVPAVCRRHHPLRAGYVHGSVKKTIVSVFPEETTELETVYSVRDNQYGRLVKRAVKKEKKNEIQEVPAVVTQELEEKKETNPFLGFIFTLTGSAAALALFRMQQMNRDVVMDPGVGKLQAELEAKNSALSEALAEIKLLKERIQALEQALQELTRKLEKEIAGKDKCQADLQEKALALEKALAEEARLRAELAALLKSMTAPTIDEKLAEIEARIIEVCGDMPPTSLSTLSTVDSGRVLELTRQLIKIQEGVFSLSGGVLDGRWTAIFKQKDSSLQFSNIRSLEQMVDSSTGKFEDKMVYSVAGKEVRLLKDGVLNWDKKTLLTTKFGFGPERKRQCIDEVLYLNKKFRISRCDGSIIIYVRLE